MRLGRLVLIVATLVTILLFPLLMRDALQALRMPSAYASTGSQDPAGRLYQNGNNNDNEDGDNGGDNNGGNRDDDDDDDNDNSNNDESDNEGEDNENDNVVCYANLNSNEEVPCDFGDNGEQNQSTSGGSAQPAPAAPASGFVPPSRRCFDVQEVGDIRLILEGGSITVLVVPPAGFPQVTWVELDDIEDLSALPAPPAGATILDRLVWRMEGGSPCDGPVLGSLPSAVNLGIPYNVPANKSRLQIVRLANNAWVEVPTVPDPDPNNPYISATVRETGVYAVIQRP